jgi:hypothetical protein
MLKTMKTVLWSVLNAGVLLILVLLDSVSDDG